MDLTTEEFVSANTGLLLEKSKKAKKIEYQENDDTGSINWRMAGAVSPV